MVSDLFMYVNWNTTMDVIFPTKTINQVKIIQYFIAALLLPAPMFAQT